MIQARPYQEIAINRIAGKFRDGFKRLLLQLATGGGKTFTFAFLIQRYLKVYDKKVLILVHRDELLKQTVKTLSDVGLKADAIDKGKKYRDYDSGIYVSMVETANNKLKKSKCWFGDIGLLIVDEAHIGNFRKVYDHFPESLILGFTATPISSSKKLPMKGEFEDIVTAIDIPTLIDNGNLCQNITYHMTNIDRSKLKKRGDDYLSSDMAKKFGAKRNVQNTVEAYERYGIGKTIIFNCNIEHSQLVNDAFLAGGYNSKHLDSNMKDERDDIISWFKQTPDAILHNVGILTAGFDEISIETVIINRSTMSLPLWLQMTGRGARPINEKVIAEKQKEYNYPLPIKDHFIIIDLGGNALAHGDWCAKRDWYQLFHYPEMSSGGGVAPVRDCKGCGAIIAAGARVCKYCGHIKEAKQIAYDLIAPEFIKFTDVNIDVGNIIERNKEYNQYRSLHIIKAQVVKRFKQLHKSEIIGSEHVDIMKDAFLRKIKTWCKEQGKRYNEFHRTVPLGWLETEIQNHFKIVEPEVLDTNK